MNFEKMHICEKSEGKIVCIELDMLGNTYCSYCHEKVNYKQVENEN